ncbi:MAG: SDR family NAD(P)-dependent oxidoreductase [Fimbriimonas sp.]|nr:SDR family NAD(P)-dependent oxidoreductase [Fimbriimonas sp.]
MSRTPSETVWFVTGSSTGFGLCLVEELLSTGYLVSGTLRNPDALSHLREQYPDRLITPVVDVTKPEQTRSAVAETVAKWGRIDVLANNAGYGLGGMIEDVPMEEVREVFETNVFGAIETIRAVLPTMRDQRSGVILNVSSIVGLVAYRGSGFYAATKHALEAVSESLSIELAGWGIKVVAIEPGPFRTDFAGRSYRWPSQRMAEYDELYEVVFKIYGNMNGSQAGDPLRAAKLMIEVSECPEPPLRLPMGQFAYEETELYVESIVSDREKWKDRLLATDYPPEP